MKLVTYRASVAAAAKLGVVDGDLVVDLARLGALMGADLPDTTLALINAGHPGLATLKPSLEGAEGDYATGVATDLANVTQLAPIPRPRKNTCGIGLNHVEHVAEIAASPESARDKGYRNLKTATMHASHDLILYQTVQQEWYEAVSHMCGPLRIDLAKMHEEIGGGFMEACIGAGEGLEPADQLVLLKNFIRALAMRQGRCVTFMPRWTEDADSQSIHVHISLKDAAGKPIFYQDGEKNGISQTFRHFIGGLQRYIGDMTLICQPTVNSYRRFAPGTFAPPGLTWGYENRTTCFRVVGHDAGSLRVENRLPGADTNPYLTAAATIAAGVAGIVEQIEPEPEVIGNGHNLSGDRPDFARSMPEAIDRLRNSAFARDWLGTRFVEAFAATRQSQYDQFRKKVPDVELQRFFDLG